MARISYFVGDIFSETAYILEEQLGGPTIRWDTFGLFVLVILDLRQTFAILAVFLWASQRLPANGYSGLNNLLGPHEIPTR